MQLFVLAAGVGKRLGQLTNQSPKVLVDLPTGTNLLEHHIRTMEVVSQIDEMLIVSGFAAEKIDAAVLNLKRHKSIRTQYNPFYDISGPIVSVWLTQYQMYEDFLLCNGDTIYSVNAFERMAACKSPVIVLGVDRDTRRNDDDMKVELDGLGNLIQVGKDIPYERAHAISTGLLAVKGESIRNAFKNLVNEMIRDRKNLTPSVAWHSTLNGLVTKGINVATLDLTTDDWYEIDSPEDIQLAMAHFKWGFQ